MLLRSGRRAATGKKEVRATVPRKTRREGPDRFSSLPDEILQEVLVRLPARSVIRCRAVCRSWRQLASDPAFLLDHHRRQPELPLISSSITVDGADEPTTRLEAVQLRGAEFRPVFMFPEIFWDSFYFHVAASCDGMVIVGSYICNPATRQSRPFSRNPKLDVSRTIGLYRHQPSGEYRVLFRRRSSLLLDILPHPAEYEYCVLTVGSYEVREINDSITLVDGVDCVLSEVGPWIFDAPVFLNGSLHMHWKKRSFEYYHWIMVFDTEAESFRHMRPPSLNPGRGAHLFDMGGMPAVCTSNNEMPEMSIFVLQDHEHDVWAFQYQIKLPVMDNMRFEEQYWSAKVVSEHGDVLVSCSGQLLHCDKKGNLVANYLYHNDLPEVIPHRLKESLIQPTFFQRENNRF